MILTSRSTLTTLIALCMGPLLLCSCERDTSGLDDLGAAASDRGTRDLRRAGDTAPRADRGSFPDGGAPRGDGAPDRGAAPDTAPAPDAHQPGDLTPPDAPPAPDSTPPPDLPAAECGNDVQEPGEACDDGDTEDGDYCSGDCQSVTGRCGDHQLQDNESCDDGVTKSCETDHDGGDGACVPPGTCSPGYVLGGGGACVSNGTGLTEPCQSGPGWTLFRFHYGGGSKSPSVDVWGASCSYSFAPNSACNVYAIYPGFGEVGYTSQGYPVLTTSNYLRVRFSVSGLSFTSAAVYIQARSYATAASTYFDIWSPLYGGLNAGPVDNDWVYDWYGVDWTGFLHPSDSPSLTAIQIYGAQGSGKLAVRAVELCVQ